ncbi:MAG: DM13 domain-containing protein [Acidimicrobiia bacterium]|nr:DM13 domain-containing protein [Acidimicrobiia bacterium]
MRRFLDFVVTRWKVTLPVGIALIAVGTWLAFGVFGIQTLFTDDVVDEAPPDFAVGNLSGLEGDDITEDMADDMSEAMTTAPPAAEVAEPVDEVVVEPMIGGSFIDRSHPTTGTATILSDGEGRRVLRFEGFETDNGPDLNVYLSTAPPDAPAGDFDGDFVDLGDLKGNIGDQNYEIPPAVDLGVHSTVVIWCVRFSVAFGAAPLS